MKTIVITGDSWGCGEWQRATEPPGTQQQIISHPGLTQYFIDDGYNVANLSQYSMGNHTLIDPLYYFLDVNRHLNIKHVFFIQTDITRSIRDKFFDFNKFSKDKNNNLEQIIRYMYYDVYSKLNHIGNVLGYNITLIGGLSDLVIDVGEFNHLNFLVPSWVKLLDESAKISHLLDHVNMEHLLAVYNDKEQLLPFIEELNVRHDIWKNNPNFFWPDGNHPNRIGHKVLYDYIKNSKLLD